MRGLFYGHPSMACDLQELQLCTSRGDAVDLPIRIETRRLRWIPITAISNAAPVRITTDGAHGLSHGWRACVMSVGGMTDINAEGPLPRERDLRPAEVVAANQIEFNEINASRFGTYTNGGYLVCYEPLDFTDITGARMQCNDPEGNRLAYFDSDGGPDSKGVVHGTLALDPSNGGLRLQMTEAQAIAKTFDECLFDIELVRAGFGPFKACAPTSRLVVIGEQTTDHT